MKRVRFTGCSKAQHEFGNNTGDPSKLKIGEEYTVEKEVLHTWHINVYLKGFEGNFNSVCFEEIKEDKHIPWRTYEYGKAHYIERTADYPTCSLAKAVWKDDADRIVACVNACAGISNKALEKGIVKAGINALEERFFSRLKPFRMHEPIPTFETFKGVIIREEEDGE